MEQTSGSPKPSPSKKTPLSQRSSANLLSSQKRASPSQVGSGSSSKKHKVAPSSATSFDFQLINPLLKISIKPQIENHISDKFSGGMMDRKALKTFFAWGPGRALLRSLAIFHDTDGKELKYRAALCSIFSSFHMLSKGNAKVVEVKDIIGRAQTESEEDIGDSMAENTCHSSQTPISQQVIHEYGDCLEGNQAVDFVLQTFPKNKAMEVKQEAEYWGDDQALALAVARKEKKNWRSVALIDSKDATLARDWEDKYLFQVGLYGAKIVEDNLKKGFVRPFYMICMSDQDLRLASIDAFGLLEVTDNNVTLESFTAFDKMQCRRMDWMKKKKAPIDVMKRPLALDDLNVILEKMKERFQAAGFSGIPDDKYVVGFFYKDPKRYTWDGNMDKLKLKGPISNETLFLMEGLLRLMVGDKVLGWSDEDVRLAIQDMEKEEEIWCQEKEES